LLIINNHNNKTMSDIDFEDSHCPRRSDQESNLPHYSLVDSTLDLTPLDMGEHSPNHRRLNTTCFSADQKQNRAIGI